MTVENTNSTISYTGNSSVTTFAYNFLTYSTEHLFIYFDDVLQTSGFTITGIGDDNGGDVTFVSPPITGVTIRIDRTVPDTQLLAYQEYGPFPAKANERGLDLLTMAVQQTARNFNRGKMDKRPLAAEDNIIVFDDTGNSKDSGFPVFDGEAKMDRIPNAGTGNFVTFDSNGNSANSGINTTSFFNKMDKAPTSNIDNVVIFDSAGNAKDSGKKLNEVGNGGSYIGENPPTFPQQGDRWTRCTDMKGFIYYIDADSAQWVEDRPSYGDDTIGDVSIPYIFDTVADYQASTIVFPIGKTIHLNDRQADFTVISGTAAGNGTTVIPSDEVNQSISEVEAAAVSIAFDSIFDARAFNTKRGAVVLADGAVCSIASYASGWGATLEGATGGGDFVFELGSTLNDGVVNFLTADSTGSFRRIESSEVHLSWAGGRVDNLDTENDVAVSAVVAYCSANEKGFRVKGIHEITQGFNTTNIDFVSGYHRDHDGFHLNASAGKTLIRWERPTTLTDLLVRGDIVDKSINDGSIGIDRCPYITRAERIRVQNFGKGIHWHSSVDCHIKQLWVGGCHIGIQLDGYDGIIATNFSTTGSLSDSEIHGNYDGVVVGNYGAFSTAFIGFNFHNTVFEQNTHIGLVCINGVSMGDTYVSLQLRELTFTGYVWFETHALIYDLTNCQGVTWTAQVRNEDNDPFIDNTDPSRSTRVRSSGLRAGCTNVADPNYANFTSVGVDHIDGSYYAPDAPLTGIRTNLDSGELAGGLEVIQKLDFSTAGRVTDVAFYTKNEFESEAVKKMYLNRNGNLTITGSYSPFTGVHLFYSDTFINAGMAVKGDSFDKITAEGLTMGGVCSLTTKEDDAGCLGLVDYCEKLASGYLIAVAAVGDNSTASMEGAVVEGEFEVGDYLSTSSTPGRLKAYNGDSMKPVVIQVKGNRHGLAYGYFK